jgi:glycosyltransferase involved in cell wall biosynthesis
MQGSTPIVYRGQLHTEISRISYLVETTVAAYGPASFFYLAPRGGTHREEVVRFVEGFPQITHLEYMEGGVTGASHSLGMLRGVNPGAHPVVAIGSTSVLFAHAIPGPSVVWCVNGVPEERLLHDTSWKSRMIVEATWRSATSRRRQLAVTVSKPMEELIRRRCRPSDTFVAPCCVDISTFSGHATEDPKRRRFVTYLGSGAIWQGLDRVGVLWQMMHRLDPECRFRVISRDPATRLLARGLAPEVVQFVSADRPDAVAASLAEASVGFLVRQPGLVNQVSFPMKFGEYVAAGVPVVASRLGWDIDQIIEETTAGVLLDWDAPPAENARLVTDLLRRPADQVATATAMAAQRLDRPSWVLRLRERLVQWRSDSGSD